MTYEKEYESNAFFTRPVLPHIVLKEGSIMVEITSPLGADKLIFESMEGKEAISELYEFKVRVYSEDIDIDFKKLLGESVAVCLQTSGSYKRYISGIVAQVKFLQTFVFDTDTDARIAYYGLIIRPQFWKSHFSKNSRVFFQKSIKEIIETVLKEDGVDFTNKASSLGGDVCEYCVQYNETNFNFVSRLMEQEGFFYFFEHTSSGSTMILAEKNKDAIAIDDAVSAKIMKSGTVNSLFSFYFQNQIVSKQYASVDYDYTNPDTLIKAKGSGEGLFGDVYEYPGGYIDSDGASKVSERRVQELTWTQNLAYGEGSIYSFVPGGAFALEDHPRSQFNQKYLIYSVLHRVNIDSRDFLYLNSFCALPETVPFMPLRKAVKPSISGTQTAVVVGPSDQEVNSDEEGRILIQFHWDAEAQNDGKTSCPVRCMQSWAGDGLGWVALPRIGMEVVVSFVNGDPDRPLVIGCVYNGKNKMPSEAAEKPEILILKTKTTPKDEEKANLMSFDDTKDNEKITFNATKDFELSSIAKENVFLLKQDGENTKTQLEVTEGLVEAVIKKGEKSTTIEEGNFTIFLKKGSMTLAMYDGDDVTTITKGNYILSVDDGEATITVKKGLKITSEDVVIVEAKKDVTVQSEAGIVMKAQKDISLKATGSIVLNATKSIEMTATKNIEMTATADVVIDAKAVTNTAKMDFAVDALNVKLTAKLDCNREGLNIADAAKLNCNREGLMIKDEAKVQATFGGTVMATLEGKVQASVKGGAMAAIGGAITALG
ncbi:MAG: type VI secretion system tip protein VgrG [Holosporales bacterium]|jgi:type VI secretion system secreted protein VgrG|nr:type VI secretion system tip protein VgrG [Holosporales bacterium]